MEKLIIYQVLTRLFGNNNPTRKSNGEATENGCGKMNDFTSSALRSIRKLGATHIWFTGILEHATQTVYPDRSTDSLSIVKGKAGSPYAIRDYYDIDPDLAVCLPKRMNEFEQLIDRTHTEGLKVLIDFVPNHVARVYHSDTKPEGIEDFGAKDCKGLHFSPQNNFYYCPDSVFNPQFDIRGYTEYPAKATGNDCFSPSPSKNDWYETVKLNYGIDYTGGGQTHFNPIPDTWIKMREILLFWAGKQVDGFRCDMAEMVPVSFWNWVIAEVKKIYPNTLFIAEVYNPTLYRKYIFEGRFDYLYDKVGLYDTLRDIICGYRPASCITQAWQSVDDINRHMLNFLENHDEQRIASDFFAKEGDKAIPAVIVSTLLTQAPFMLYFGQELGEKGMDEEGFSGRDGRTTIFDYWSLDKIIRWQNGNKFNEELLTMEEKKLRLFYQKIFQIAHSEKSVTSGSMYDLTFLNTNNPNFDITKQFAWIRKYEKEALLIVVNFDENQADTMLSISKEAHDFLNLRSSSCKKMKDLLSGTEFITEFKPDSPLNIVIKGNNGVILKFTN